MVGKSCPGEGGVVWVSGLGVWDLASLRDKGQDVWKVK